MIKTTVRERVKQHNDVVYVDISFTDTSTGQKVDLYALRVNHPSEVDALVTAHEGKVAEYFKDNEKIVILQRLLNGDSPATINFVYNTKRELLQALYDNEVVPEEARATSSLGFWSNLRNKIQLAIA